MRALRARIDLSRAVDRLRAVKPLVGVTAGVDHNGEGPARYRLNAAYMDAVAEAGAEPVVLMPGADGVALLDRLHGLVLTGGADVDPALYGAPREPETQFVDTRRDDLEIPLTRAAFERGLPILAICRGQQVLNVALGGTLVQHLATHPKADYDADRSVISHQVRLDPGSHLAEVLGAAEVPVNSFHHQAIAELAPALAAAGWSEDGVVEAVEARQDPGRVLSVQCHPEELTRTQPWARRLFEAFVERARG